jgi:Zn finger protein HypA/HybF involved in hydrogenase expression
MKDEEKDTTYEVRLLCRNCNKDWIKEVEKGTYIRYEKDNNYMIKANDPKQNKILFQCPKCGAHNKIARLPLDN